MSSVFHRTPVAILNLLSNRTRALVSLGGVGFALLLIFMQLGFRGAVGNTATIVYGRMTGDIVMRSPDYAHLYEPKSIDRGWMRLVEGHPDVEEVAPFFVMLQKWQNPRNESEGGACSQNPSPGSFRTVGMMGMELDHVVLELSELPELLQKLKDPNAMLVDRATKAEYGPQNCKAFSEQDISVHTELGGRDTEIAGVFRLGTGLATNGAVLVSDVGFRLRSPIDTTQRASLGLITLKPGIDRKAALQSIQTELKERAPEGAESVVLLSMRDQMEWERDRWLNETPIGMIFTMGVILSFIIGAAIVYMVLATEVTARISEFATLKAMGYSHWYVSGIVLRQAWLLAVGGYLGAVLASLGLYKLTASLSGIPTFMTAERLLVVAFLAWSMCTLSGLIAIRKLGKVDPADLF